MKEMLHLIQKLGDFDSGSQQPRLIAQDWLDEGFDHQQAEAWISSGCWSPPLAKSMAEAGITPELAGLPEGD